MRGMANRLTGIRAEFGVMDKRGAVRPQSVSRLVTMSRLLFIGLRRWALASGRFGLGQKNIDTNVLVVGLLSRFDPLGVIVSLKAAGRLSLCCNAGILAEYAEVAHRPAFPFDAGAVIALTIQIEAGGVLASPRPLTKRLPDADDEPFLEVAVAARAEYVVPGNSAGFPPECRAGVGVVSPREFIDSARVCSDRGVQRDEERATG